MFNFMCKTFPYVSSSVRIRTHELYFLQCHPFSLSNVESISNSSNQQSFTLSYLINTCGFPPEKALSASKYINFETPNKPDSVLAFFKNHGFTKTQISNLVKGFPPVLLCDPQKTLLPKLEFFNSIGFSNRELSKVITSNPAIFKRSLENQIIPSFNFLKTLLQSDVETAVIKHSLLLLCDDLPTRVSPNVEILREFGVPNSNIVFLLKYQPRVFMTNTVRFRQTVEEVKKMGFNPVQVNFVLAVLALRAMSKLTWEKKVKVYKKFGLSEDEILIAFGKYPWCMMASEEKIMGVMDLLINKMGRDSSVVARIPQLISLSLEKRLIPRCLILQVMLTKGFIKKDYSICLLTYPEKKFLNKISKCCGEDALELMKLYQEKLGLSK